MAEVANDVIAIIAKKVPGDKKNIKLSDNLQELGLESIDALEMIFDLEETFDIHIEINANRVEEVDESWQDVGRAIETVSQLVSVRAASR